MQSQIDELKKDIGVFFKWHHLMCKHEEILRQKHDAVRKQDFEKAAILRGEEGDVYSQWVECNKELSELVPKYAD